MALGALSQSLQGTASYKDFTDAITQGKQTDSAPVTYYPFSAAYNAGWRGGRDQIALSAAINLAFRGAGSSTTAFDNKRYRAQGNFIYLRSPPLEHVMDPEGGFLSAFRLLVFADYAHATLLDPLPAQASYWNLTSLGAGVRSTVLKTLHLDVDYGAPLAAAAALILGLGLLPQAAGAWANKDYAYRKSIALDAKAAGISDG